MAMLGTCIEAGRLNGAHADKTKLDLISKARLAVHLAGIASQGGLLSQSLKAERGSPAAAPG